MKRLSLTLASVLLAAGCASQPPAQRGAATMPVPNNPPGQSEPLPRQQNPGYDQTGGAGQDNGSGYASGPAQAPQQPGSQAPTTAPPKSAEEISSPAVMSLLGRADTLANNGNMDDAAATLERALDLDPRNPFIYQRLSAVRLAQNQAGQAEQLAMKSNSVAGDNPFVQAGNWRLIAEARKTAGNAKGAQAAQAQAVNYRQSADQYNR